MLAIEGDHKIILPPFSTPFPVRIRRCPSCHWTGEVHKYILADSRASRHGQARAPLWPRVGLRPPSADGVWTGTTKNTETILGHLLLQDSDSEDFQNINT